MFNDKELRTNFFGEQNEQGKKSRWYMILDYINTNLYPDEKKAITDQVLTDDFWSDEEKEEIQKVIDGKEIPDWIIEYRMFGGGEHLDFCVIYSPVMIKRKREEKMGRLENELACQIRPNPAG